MAREITDGGTRRRTIAMMQDLERRSREALHLVMSIGGQHRMDTPLPPGHWSFQDDATPLAHVMRSAYHDGPQHVSIVGLGDVVVISAHEFHRLRDGRTGQALIDACATSPYRDVEIAPERGPLPVRDLSL